MIPQLALRVQAKRGLPPDQARLIILGADPLDLVLHLEQVWDMADTAPQNGNGARNKLAAMGAFNDCDPKLGPPPPQPPRPFRVWDHLGYSYVLENTRVVQIMKRVVRAFRNGEPIGYPDAATLRWLDAAEALLWGGANPFSSWLTTTPVGADAEAERRNAYWRLLGLDLAFPSEDERAPSFAKPRDANTSFVTLFEELLFELWQAIMNMHNFAGANSADDDRIFRLAEALGEMLRTRRHGTMHGSILSREELAAATVLGFLELTLSDNTPVVVAAGADATTPANRLAQLGAKVGLAPHSKAAAMFSMASELSTLLKTIESGVVTSSSYSWILYRATPQQGITPVGDEARRVITEWAAATGRDLKTRGKPVETASAQRRLVAVQ